MVTVKLKIRLMLELKKYSYCNFSKQPPTIFLKGENFCSTQAVSRGNTMLVEDHKQRLEAATDPDKKKALMDYFMEHTCEAT